MATSDYKFKGATNMLTDIQIAQQATLKPIAEIASGLGILPYELELYGN